MPGHRVRVIGEVREHFGLTEIALTAPDALSDLGAAPPVPPSMLTALAAAGDTSAAIELLESHEGMRVALAPSVVVAATNGFGEAYVMPRAAGVSRVFRAHLDRRLLGLVPTGDTPLALEQGDVIDSGLVGPLTFAYRRFGVVLGDVAAAAIVVEPSQRVPTRASPAESGELTLATYNLENFFDAVDDPGKNDGPNTPSPACFEVATTRRARPDVPVVVMGDLNAYEDSAALATLRAAGLEDLHTRVPDDDDYTYVFNGASQILDYVLVTRGVDVKSVEPIHANADFAAPAPCTDDVANPRSSDHDPLRVRVRVRLAGRQVVRQYIYLPLALALYPPDAGGVSTAPPMDTPTGPTRRIRMPTAMAQTVRVGAVREPPVQEPSPAASCSRQVGGVAYTPMKTIRNATAL